MRVNGEHAPPAHGSLPWWWPFAVLRLRSALCLGYLGSIALGDGAKCYSTLNYCSRFRNGDTI